MYKSLNLERETVCSNIETFLKQKEYTCNVLPFEDKGNRRRRVQVTGDLEFFVDFHFLDDGSTTIDLSSGKKHSVKTEIADFLKVNSNEILIDVESSNKWFIIENIKDEDFETIIVLILECVYYKNTLIEQGSIGQDRMIKIRGSYNENLTIHYYNNNKKVMLQGRPLLLFNEAVVYFTQLIELEAIPKAFNDYFNVDVKKDNVEEQYQYYFPNSYSKIPNKPKKALYQSIYNLQLLGDMYEYSFLLFPALRVLEGHLKVVLAEWGIPMLTNNFSMFEFNDIKRKHSLKNNFIGGLSTKQIEYIENAYNFFRRQRHSLFHWSNPSNIVDDTRMIDNIGEAKGLVTDTFKIIDEFYRVYVI